jgi:alkanesulfonate monooxygenase SsuD/methylene tetrahydromethanopterin reductase-like flavin-dependent oxidoreductase (luciferase family)
VKIGVSLRFLFPTSPQTDVIFETLLAAAKGEFIDRPLGARDTDVQARNLVDTAGAAARLGLDMLVVGDHHAVPAVFANAFQPVPTLARLLAVSGRMTVGMVVLAPFYNPVLLAEQLGTLAAFAEGPLVVALAAGGREAQFRAFGMALASRTRRLEEGATVLRSLLAGEAVVFQGRYHALDGVQVSPRPRQPVAIWLAGTTRAAAGRAGRLGDGWLTSAGADHAALAEQVDAYAEAAARAGRPVCPVLRRDVYVGESDADAEAVVEPILAKGYRGWGREALLVGGPRTVAQQLRAYGALGFERVLVRPIVGDHELVLASLDRLGRHVLPEVG